MWLWQGHNSWQGILDGEKLLCLVRSNYSLLASRIIDHSPSTISPYKQTNLLLDMITWWRLLPHRNRWKQHYRSPQGGNYIAKIPAWSIFAASDLQLCIANIPDTTDAILWTSSFLRNSKLRGSKKLSKVFPGQLPEDHIHLIIKEPGK